MTKSWADHCKEVGVTFIKGGVNAPQHNHFIFVETDDMSKLRDLMQPFIGYWDVVITPVMNLPEPIRYSKNPSRRRRFLF